MKKNFLILASLICLSSAFASRHLSEKDKKATLKCAGTLLCK